MSKITKVALEESRYSANEQRYELREQTSSIPDSDETCKLCKSDAIVFDIETSESVCSSCGMVLHDNIETLGPEWKIYSSDDVESKSRTGMPTSLAFHDMGLSTFISYSNTDANGAVISPEQLSKVQRMRRWNKIS